MYQNSIGLMDTVYVIQILLDCFPLGVGALHPAQLLHRERRGAAALCPVRPHYLRQGRRQDEWRTRGRLGQHLLRHRVSGRWKTGLNCG